MLCWRIGGVAGFGDVARYHLPVFRWPMYALLGTTLAGRSNGDSIECKVDLILQGCRVTTIKLSSMHFPPPLIAGHDPDFRALSGESRFHERGLFFFNTLFNSRIRLAGLLSLMRSRCVPHFPAVLHVDRRGIGGSARVRRALIACARVQGK